MTFSGPILPNNASELHAAASGPIVPIQISGPIVPIEIAGPIVPFNVCGPILPAG